MLGSVGYLRLSNGYKFYPIKRELPLYPSPVLMHAGSYTNGLQVRGIGFLSSYPKWLSLSQASASSGERAKGAGGQS